MNYIEDDCVDSRNTITSNVSIFNATKGTSSVRLEHYGLFQTILYIQEASKTDAYKLNHHSLVALRDVLNRWYELVNKSE